jgi:quercetin dioxygenase-like cupin family protein
VITVDLDLLELSDAWVDDDDRSRWRTTAALTPADGSRASGSVLLEVEPEHRLEPHTDSAEETIVVLAGTAEVILGGEAGEVTAGGLALIPVDVIHEVRNAGQDPLRFLAIYASADVVTRYERPVAPDGVSEKRPLE